MLDAAREMSLSQLDDLRVQLSTAVAEEDFLQAAALKQQIEAMMRSPAAQIEMLRSQMNAAVAGEDFLRAAQLKQQIEATLHFHLSELRARLAAAVAAEDFFEAAEMKHRIEALEGPRPLTPPKVQVRPCICARAPMDIGADMREDV